MVDMSADLFVGTWQLDPMQNKYEFGDPPQQGLYIIEPNGTGYLVTMKWTNTAGKALEMQYEATPDGVEYPANAPGVDTMSMTRVDERTLDSAAMAGGQVIAYGRRVLSEDGQTMTITQSGKTPDGKEFSNLSVYVRQG
jgi:hypothetical protein